MTKPPKIERLPYVKFKRIQDDNDMQEYATHLLGIPCNKLMILKRFNIDLDQFIGFFVDVGGDANPTGPMFKGQIKPILAIRQNENNTFSPHLMKVEGLLHHQQQQAWLPVAEWEQLLDDTYFEEKTQEVNTEIEEKLTELEETEKLPLREKEKNTTKWHRVSHD